MKNKEMLGMIVRNIVCLKRDIYENKKINETILENQYKDITKNNELVIMYNKGKTRVYEKGEDISKGITEIYFTADNAPTIKYEKSIF